jgi:hypothetical protein
VQPVCGDADMAAQVNAIGPDAAAAVLVAEVAT